MKTIKKTTNVPVTISIPLTIRIVDVETGEVLGEATTTLTGSTTITVEYEYEVPEWKDFLTKGAAPAVGADLLLRLIVK